MKRKSNYTKFRHPRHGTNAQSRTTQKQDASCCVSNFARIFSKIARRPALSLVAPSLHNHPLRDNQTKPLCVCHILNGHWVDNVAQRALHLTFTVSTSFDNFDTDEVRAAMLLARKSLCFASRSSTDQYICQSCNNQQIAILQAQQRSAGNPAQVSTIRSHMLIIEQDACPVLA